MLLAVLPVMLQRSYNFIFKPLTFGFIMSAHETHESPIKTPKQLITVILLCFIVPISLLILLAGWVSGGMKPAAGTEAFGDKAVAARLQPVASNVYKAVGEVRTGEQVYSEVCTSCHAAGLAGAPKFGDVAAWGSRLKAGLEGLMSSVIKGKGNMPARGGDPTLSDAEIQNAVAYMANAAGAKFPTAVAPAPAAAVATTATTPVANTVDTGVATAAAMATMPAATVAAALAPVVAPVMAADAGKTLYQSACIACHGPGAAGAPKFGDKAAWSVRGKVGVDALTASAIKGKNAMPARGGSQASDAQIKQTVQYMLDAAK
jgi:cytochrome c5